MKILLCAATEMEIAPTIHFLTTHPYPKVDILITGIGLTAATYSITKGIANGPDLVIQAGIAGSLDTNLPLSEVVVVENESIGDIGVYEQGSFRSLFDMKFLHQDIHPFKEKKLPNTHPYVQKSGLPVVDGVTVNEISTNPDKINSYRHQLKAKVETMEGAALHYVGIMENVPFLQIRSVSNFIGERDKTKWMMQASIANLNTEVQKLLSNF